jgi:hypothetical protein
MPLRELTESDYAVIEQVLQHDGFAVLEEWVDSERERLVRKLESVKTPIEDVNHIRGQLYTLALMRRESLARVFGHAQEGPDA